MGELEDRKHEQRFYRITIERRYCASMLQRTIDGTELDGLRRGVTYPTTWPYGDIPHTDRTCTRPV